MYQTYSSTPSAFLKASTMSDRIGCKPSGGDLILHQAVAAGKQMDGRAHQRDGRSDAPGD